MLVICGQDLLFVIIVNRWQQSPSFQHMRSSPRPQQRHFRLILGNFIHSNSDENRKTPQLKAFWQWEGSGQLYCNVNRKSLKRKSQFPYLLKWKSSLSKPLDLVLFLQPFCPVKSEEDQNCHIR